MVESHRASWLAGGGQAAGGKPWAWLVTAWLESGVLWVGWGLLWGGAVTGGGDQVITQTRMLWISAHTVFT